MGGGYNFCSENEPVPVPQIFLDLCEKHHLNFAEQIRYEKSCQWENNPLHTGLFRTTLKRSDTMGALVTAVFIYYFFTLGQV